MSSTTVALVLLWEFLFLFVCFFHVNNVLRIKDINKSLVTPYNKNWPISPHKLIILRIRHSGSKFTKSLQTQQFPYLQYNSMHIIYKLSSAIYSTVLHFNEFETFIELLLYYGINCRQKSELLVEMHWYNPAVRINV